MATNTSAIWRFVSNFFNFFNDASREFWEFLWEGFADVAHENDKKAGRFVLSTSPELAKTDPVIDYYDIEINILKSRPIYLDPSTTRSRYNIIIKNVLFSNPVGIGRESVRRDMLEISKNDYYDIRLIAIGLYIVIKVDNPDTQNKYFVIRDLKSPEEIGDRYFDRYVIQLDNANLSYVSSDEKVTVHITDGKVYKVDNFVIDIPELYTNVTDQRGTQPRTATARLRGCEIDPTRSGSNAAWDIAA